MLKTLPETPERDQRELQLLVNLGVPLHMTQGPTAPDAETVHDRARELCQRLDVAPQLAPAYLGLMRYYGTRGKLQTVGELGDKLLTLARCSPDLLLLPTAYAARSGIRFFMGDFTTARVEAERATEKYDVQKHSSLIFLHGEDPGIMGLTFQAWTLWYLGYPDQALHKCQEAYILAQAIPHPFNVSQVQMYVAFLHHLRGESQETQHWTDALITLSTDQEVPFWLAPGFVLRGWVLTEKGAWTEGIALMRQGLEQVQALGAEIWWIVYQALLGEVYLRVRRLDERRRCLEEALAKAQEVGEFFHSAELYRLQGELLFAQENIDQKAKSQGQKGKFIKLPHPTPNPQAEAEACFLQAVDIARRQQAKSLELRATVSLARL